MSNDEHAVLATIQADLRHVVEDVAEIKASHKTLRAILLGNGTQGLCGRLDLLEDSVRRDRRERKRWLVWWGGVLGALIAAVSAFLSALIA